MRVMWACPCAETLANILAHAEQLLVELSQKKATGINGLTGLYLTACRGDGGRRVATLNALGGSGPCRFFHLP